MHLEPLSPKHYPDLHAICNITDKWTHRTTKEFLDEFSEYGGWAVMDKTRVAGYIILSGHIPYFDVAVHCSVLPEYHSKWMTRNIYKTVFNHVFVELKLPRCSSWLFDGYSNPTFLERLGFKKEGVRRSGYIINDKWVDVQMYGMLPEERRWK